ncbi:MAG: hypothetical protein ACT4NX_06920 [Deltaproteobacteria bacterium]
MKRFTSLFVGVFVLASVALSGCDGKVKEEYERVKAEVEQLAKDKTDLETKITELMTEVDAVKAENEQLKTQIAAAQAPAASPAPEGEMPQEAPAQ